MSEQHLFFLLPFSNHRSGCPLLCLFLNHSERLSSFKLAHLITVLLLVSQSQRRRQQRGYSRATVLDWGIDFDIILESFPSTECPSVHSYLSFYHSLSSPSLSYPSAGFHYSICSSIKENNMSSCFCSTMADAFCLRRKSSLRFF